MILTEDGVVADESFSVGSWAQATIDVDAVSSAPFASVVVEIDGTVRLWDTVRGGLVGTLWSGTGVASPSPPWYDALTDSVWVATSGTLLRFSLDTERWVERACDLAGRELTSDEWDRLVPGDSAQRPACR